MVAMIEAVVPVIISFNVMSHFNVKGVSFSEMILTFCFEENPITKIEDIAIV